MVANLSKKVKELPRTPGVYIFKNAQGKPIYVGKASRLRDRVRTYFTDTYAKGEPLHERMQGDIADIKVHETASEIEALVLESAYIKAFKPRYNIVMRDDKQYFYVGFTKELFPKIILLHQLHTKKYILRGPALGPFISGRSLKVTLYALRKIFPFCSCRRMHKSEKSCLNYAIGIDPGYCCVKDTPAKSVSQREYQANIRNIQRILRGQKTSVLKELRKDMDEFARKQNFERAANVRNQIERIEHILAHKRVIEGKGETKIFLRKDSRLKAMRRIEAYDISNVQGQFAVGSMVVAEQDDEGSFGAKKSDYRRFKIKFVKGANDPAMMHEVLIRRLRHSEWQFPELMLIDGGKAQRNAALKALTKTLHGENMPLVWGLAKREEELYTDEGILPLARLGNEEARLLAFLRDEAHRFAITYYRKVHKKEFIP